MQNLYSQPTNVPTNFNSLNTNAYGQQQLPQQQPLYGQQGQFGGFGQQQPNNQFGMMGGYQQPMQQGYGQPYQQPMMQGQMGMGLNMNMGFGQQYQQPQSSFIVKFRSIPAATIMGPGDFTFSAEPTKTTRRFQWNFSSNNNKDTKEG
jgi:hypothetical protein